MEFMSSLGPATMGEWMCFGVAAITILLGLIRLFVPDIVLRLQRLQPVPEHPEAFAAVRATMAGFYLGLGVSSVVFQEPRLYIALGFSWAFTAFGRLISILSDRNTMLNWLLILVELMLGGAALANPLRFVQ